MELIILLALLLILYVVYTLFTRETFVTKGETKMNNDIHAYYTRKKKGGQRWEDYLNSEKSYDKFKRGNSRYS